MTIYYDNPSKGQEWEQWYKVPNQQVKINERYMRLYWYFVKERLSVWYNRVILKSPQPWTEDEILQAGRFTNISRDMDKLSIYEIKNILSKIDEPTTSLTARKKSILFNIILYRMYVKKESYEKFGFIDLENPGATEQYEKGKQALKLARDNNEFRPFTGSYMVYPMREANPDQSKSGDKLLNSYGVLDNVFYNIDEWYEKIITRPKNMKQQLKAIQEINCIGAFNAYEIACSIASIGRYYDNTLVPWSQDNYTNSGPGSSLGVDYIFENRGNLTRVQEMIYLRAHWDKYLKEYGWYDTFVKQLPNVFNNQVDLRMIEHCLCEFRKYVRIKDENGRPKMRFKNETRDTESLTI